jgi:signal transduction histidine kinase
VLLWFGTIVAIILILFSISFRYFLNQSINDNIQTKLYHEALETLSSFLKNKTILNNQVANGSKIAIMKDKKPLYISKDFPLENISELTNDNNDFRIYANEDDETVNAAYILKKEDYIVVIYKRDIDNKIENFEDTLLILDPILLILLIYSASKLIDKVLYPIKKITKTAKDISVNNFSQMIKQPKENDEIKELVDSFNEMIQRLKNGVENLDKFNSDISHELKTPLTVIKGEIEVTLRRLREPDEYERSMKTIYNEAEQMQVMVENLLLLTKYSKQNIEQSFELCNQDSILLDVIDKFSAKLKEKNIHLKLKNIEPVSINANMVLISSIFSNLIDNAIKYSEYGKNIYISLYKNKKVYFEIRDEGIGIEDKQVLKVTNRFYRVDESRSKNIKGFGLGLSIVKNSVELHNAKMKINSVLNQGTQVTIEFS